ncbi:MAG: SPFH domain-containing protein [Firmicutes bacterium]|nr:SPFH domain-containing protein [Bacillota bacterium]
MPWKSNISWDGDTKNTIVYKVDLKNDSINHKSLVTVREGQAAIFCVKGRMADVFLPGRYTLETGKIPILSKLLNLPFGFKNTILADIYFVNTHQWTNQPWGTRSPISVRDKDFGTVEIRGNGIYSFKVDDPYIFMQELSGSHPSFRTNEITDMLRTKVVSGITQAVGQSKIDFFDLAGNILEVAKVAREVVQEQFKAIGVQLVNINVNEFTMPPEIKEAVDRQRSMNIARSTMDVEMARAQMDVLKTAAGNPGAGGSMGAMMGAGMGMGMGMGMGNMMGNMMGGMGQGMPGAGMGGPMGAGGMGIGATPGQPMMACPNCQKQLPATAKFCSGCGQPTGESCGKCKAALKPGAKFCAECGTPAGAACAKCGAALKSGAKFCAECGTPT